MPSIFIYFFIYTTFDTRTFILLQLINVNLRTATLKNKFLTFSKAQNTASWHYLTVPFYYIFHMFVDSNRDFTLKE